MAIVLAARRPERKEMTSSSRTEAPRHDCLDEEEEGNEAELLPLADLLREASVDGGERRRPRLSRGHVGQQLGFAARGKKGGGERAERRRGASYPPGGPGREGAAEGATAMRRSWRQWFPCRHREEGGERELTVGDPLSEI